MRVRELARCLGVPFEGDGDLELTGVAPVDSAGPGDLSFINSRKAAKQAETSGAGCLIVPADFSAGRTLIRAASPRATLARAIGFLYPAARPTAGVHPTAAVAASAKIGASVSIGAHASVGENSSIGARTAISAG